ncbi:MAG: DUF3846 domain-containing protein [Phycisphaerae bacterium]|nr:DUF3846 domain-containing protein [Phycisphaerae bacterium]
MVKKNKKMVPGLLLLPDFSIEEIFPDRKDGTYSLGFLQKIVGGLIQIVYLDEDKFGGISMVMVVNEEGLLENLPVNIMASEVYGSMIVGPAIIVGNKQIY